MIGRTNTGGNFGGGAAGVISENDFTFGGGYLFNSDGTNWELALLSGSSASLNFRKNPGAVDIFLVGGGAAGGSGSGDAEGGNGGAGGECVTQQNVQLAKNTNYSITIGDSGQATTGFGKTASSGGGSPGGHGAIVTGNSRTRSASSGSAGVYAFGSSSSLINSLSGRKFGAGGGGGEAYNSSYVYSNSSSHGGSNDGGETGGGRGGLLGMNGDTAATAGGANTGAGGGGAGYRYNGGGTVGAGGSGIIIIRNHR